MVDKIISYLGPIGSFSYEAALAAFPKAQLTVKSTFTDVFNSVSQNSANLGILPVENSTEGIIPLTYHLLVEQNDLDRINIIGEIYHPIVHNLAGIDVVKLKDIKSIHTKPEVWEQCRNWVQRNLSSEVEFVAESSSSKAAEIVAGLKDNSHACISSATAINHYGLKLIEDSIQDNKKNSTRFLVLSKRCPPVTKSKKQLHFKITFGVVLQDRIGAIAKVFTFLAQRGIDVRSVKISPVRDSIILSWRDWFFIDVLTNTEYLKHVLNEINRLKEDRDLILALKILGSYCCNQKDIPLPASPIMPAIEKISSLTLEGIIAAGEGKYTEFKSSLRWNFRENKKDQELEMAVIKTIAGFMNSQGGVLLIGIDDCGNVLGLENDYKSIQKPSKDGFEQHLRNKCESEIGELSGQIIEFEFLSKENKDICKVTVQRSPRPVWVKEKGNDEFFLRAGNRTIPLPIRETAEYIHTRW